MSQTIWRLSDLAISRFWPHGEIEPEHDHRYLFFTRIPLESQARILGTRRVAAPAPDFDAVTAVTPGDVG